LKERISGDAQPLRKITAAALIDNKHDARENRVGFF
jgi:hypothetical protein